MDFLASAPMLLILAIVLEIARIIRKMMDRK